MLLVVYHDDNGSQGNQGILVFYSFITCTYHVVLLIVYHDDNGSQGNQGILVFWEHLTTWTTCNTRQNKPKQILHLQIT